MKPPSTTVIAFAALVSAYLTQFEAEAPDAAPSDGRDIDSATPGAVSPRSTCRGYTRTSR